MELLLFVILCAITVNNGIARPLTDDDLTFLTRNGLDSTVSEDDFKNKHIFMLPTVIKNGLKITINASLNTNDKTFTAILHNKIGAKEGCIIRSVFESNTITVTPGIDSYDEATYNHNLKPGEESRIALTLFARVSNYGQEMLALTFQVDEEGESDQLICDIKNFENIRYIELKEGVSHVSSLLFQFNNH